MAKGLKLEEDTLVSSLLGAASRQSISIHHLYTQFPPICSFSGIKIQPICSATPQLLEIQGNYGTWYQLSPGTDPEGRYSCTSSLQQLHVHPQSLLLESPQPLGSEIETGVENKELE